MWIPIDKHPKDTTFVLIYDKIDQHLVYPKTPLIQSIWLL